MTLMLSVVVDVQKKRDRVVQEACRSTIERQNPFARISLLPGVEYQNLNERWLVNTP